MGKKSCNVLNKIKEYFIIGLFLILWWEGIARLLSVKAFPPPSLVFVTLKDIFFIKIATHLLVSSVRAVVSVSIALVIGVPLGLLMGRNELVDKLLFPAVFLVYPIPKIVFLPIIFILIGLGEASKIFVITLIIFFQILITSRDASKQINRQFIDSIVSLGAQEWDIYKHVIFPAALPKIFTSVRISLGTALAVLFFSETFANIKGIGYFIFDAWSRVNYPEMYAGILTMGLLGLLFYLIIELLENKFCSWGKMQFNSKL